MRTTLSALRIKTLSNVIWIELIAASTQRLSADLIHVEIEGQSYSDGLLIEAGDIDLSYLVHSYHRPLQVIDFNRISINAFFFIYVSII